MRGAVATGHPRTSEAATRVLEAGGNAVDAAVAAGFAASVSEPMFTSLGGGGFLLWRGAEGRERLFDFFVDTPGRGLGEAEREPHFLPITVHFPASDQVFNIGLGSVAVPGNLAGFLHVQDRLGRLPLADVLAPALALARDGVVLTEHQAYVMGLLHPINTLSPEGRALYTPAGRDPRPGERFRNLELAGFLARLDGPDVFYRGELARRIARDMREGQGLLCEADLAAYRVVERAPLAFEYRGHRVLSNPAPSLGGSLIALSLLLQGDAPDGGAWGSASELCAAAAVIEEVERLRAEGVVAPEDLAEARRGRSRERVLSASGGTTHVSVVDAEGNAVAMTLSNGEGSGYLAPGTGIMLNNMLGEDDLHPEGFHAGVPGRRVASMMSPSLVLRDGVLRLVLGSGGSKRIRTAVTQVIRNVVDFGMDLRAAVEAPRLHWDGERLQVEPGFPPGAVDALCRRWPVNTWEERNLYFGGVHAVDGSGHAAGDPRRGGHAIVLG